MNVLILTDFSAASTNAAEYSLKLLEEIPARFYLLNTDSESSSLEPKAEERKVNVHEKLQAGLNSLRPLSKNSSHHFETLFSRDKLLNATRRYVIERDINLIVMGAVRRDFLKHTLIGNHTHEIMKKVKCNLLAIPENTRYVEPREIAIPIDYSVSLGQQVFKFLDTSGVPDDTRFTVLEMKDKLVKKSAQVALQEDLFHPLSGGNLHFSELQTDAVASKDQFLEVQKEFDMLVILGRNLSICDRFLHTEHGLYSSVENRLPILVLHN